MTYCFPTAALIVVVIAATTLCTSLVVGQEELVSLHGSGTTNPSRCYWRIMDQMESHSKGPIRMTYRAIGSGGGQSEFLRDPPITHFGSGDIPLPESGYMEFTQDKGIKVLQLPVVMGAISFFYNIPGMPFLNLTSCTLAQIFARRVTRWDDPAITAHNPNLRLPSDGLEIRVARRRDGSSSTASITKYLNIGCSHQWEEEMVGKTIAWDEDTVACQGSGGMTNCILEEVGTIGYSDSGHGLSAGLQEVNLQNLDTGNFISSVSASEHNGIAAAAALAEELPSDATQDFSTVHFIDKPGTHTWPIVAMTYVYVRQDLSYIANTDLQGLIVAWLRALYEDEYIDQCVEDFGFTRVTGAALDVALAGIDSIVTSSGAPEWKFEFDTDPGIGSDDYTISSKRNSFSVVHFQEVDETTQELQTVVGILESMVQEFSQRITTLEGENDLLKGQVGDVGSRLDDNEHTHGPPTDDGSSGTVSAATMDEITKTQAVMMEMDSVIDDNATKVNVALALGSVSLVLWVLAAAGLVGRRVFGV